MPIGKMARMHNKWGISYLLPGFGILARPSVLTLVRCFGGRGRTGVLRPRPLPTIPFGGPKSYLTSPREGFWVNRETTSICGDPAFASGP